jgi:hypothetical protein
VVVETDSSFARDEWEYWENCDGTFETGYAWRRSGLEDPYYGAFAEGYHGPIQVRGIRIYLTQMGYWIGTSMDLYVWGGGIEEPGCVLAVIPEVVPYNIPYGPDFGANDFEIDASVGNNFYVGAQANFPETWEWFVAADETNRGGSPWTCIAPRIGYPTGWNHPGVVFGAYELSMGIGVYVERPASVDELPEEGQSAESPTWGGIKALFR